MKKVVRISEYRCRDIVEALERLLAHARAGELRGIAVCAKDIRSFEHIVFCGDYLTQPTLGVGAANRMSWRLTQMMDERDAANYPKEGT